MFHFVLVIHNKILGKILTKLLLESFVKKIQTFGPKVSGNFRMKF